MGEASAASKASQKQLDLAFQFLIFFFYRGGRSCGQGGLLFYSTVLMVGTYYNLELFCRQNKSQCFYKTGIFGTEDHLHL